MLSNKLICKICGNEYEACPTCQSSKTIFKWRNVACCLEHADIYLTLVRFERNRDKRTENNIKEAKESLLRYDLSKIPFTVENKKIIDEILSTNIENTNNTPILSAKKIAKRKSVK